MAKLAFLAITFMFMGLSYASTPYNYTEVLYRECDKETSSNNDAETLVNFLAKNISGYSIYILGKLHGIIECRGDLSRQECNSCSSRLVSEWNNSCKHAYKAWIQFEGCYLRYEKRDFFWDHQDFYEVGHECEGNYSLTADEFYKVREGTVYRAPFMNGFSAGVISNGTMHFLAHCNAYLSPFECGSCLRLGLYLLRFDCYNFQERYNWLQGNSRILMDGCYLRLYQHRFYDQEVKGSWWNLAFPSRPPHKLNKKALGIGIGAAVALFAGITALILWLKMRTKRKMVKVHCIVVDGHMDVELGDAETACVP